MENTEKKETKLCKYCQSEIPKKAKVCPHCRKKQGGKLKWIIIAIVVLAIIGSAMGGGSESENVKKADSATENIENSVSSNETEKIPAEEQTVFRKGEMAESDDVQVTMTDIMETSGSEYNKPSDGNVFVLAEFEIANNTDKDIAVSSMLSFEAYADDYSLNYSLQALMEKDGNQLDGSIAAGKKMKGWIGWEVPEDYGTIEIHFTDSVWSNDKLVFVIEND